MFEGIVEQYLLRYLGEYIVGLDKQNLSVSALKGQIHLRNARLKQEAVELLNLPCQLIYGEVGTLKISFLWRNVLGSRPVVVELSQFLLKLGPKPEWSEDEERRRVQLHRQKMIDRVDLLYNVGEQSQGWMSRIVTRINDNLEVHLHDLHVRYEDAAPGIGGPPVCVGMHLDSLQVQTASADWVPTFVERSKTQSQLFKLLTMRLLSAYYVPPDCELADQPTEERSQSLASEAQPWQETFSKLEGLGHLAHILKPVSGTLQLTQNLDITDVATPRFELGCSLERIQLVLCHASYEGISGMMDLVSEYFAFQEVVRHRIEAFWPHRPQASIRRNARLWWQYAGRCVRLGMQATEQPQKPTMSFVSLLTSENLNRLRVQGEYFKLVRQDKAGTICVDDKARLQSLEASLQLNDIQRWRIMILESLQQEALQEEAAQREAATVAGGQRRPWSWFSPGARPGQAVTPTIRTTSSHQSLSEEVSPTLNMPSISDEWQQWESSSPKLEDDVCTMALELPAKAAVVGNQEPLPTDSKQQVFPHLPSVGSWLVTRLEKDDDFCAELPSYDMMEVFPNSRQAAPAVSQSQDPIALEVPSTRTIACHSINETSSTIVASSMPILQVEAAHDVQTIQPNFGGELLSQSRSESDGMHVCSAASQKLTVHHLPSTASVVDTDSAGPGGKDIARHLQTPRDSFNLLPSVGTWLHMIIDNEEDNGENEQPKQQEDQQPEAQKGGFYNSLYKWLMPRTPAKKESSVTTEQQDAQLRKTVQVSDSEGQPANSTTKLPWRVWPYSSPQSTGNRIELQDQKPAKVEPGIMCTEDLLAKEGTTAAGTPVATPDAVQYCIEDKAENQAGSWRGWRGLFSSASTIAPPKPTPSSSTAEECAGGSNALPQPPLAHTVGSQ